MSGLQQFSQDLVPTVQVFSDRAQPKLQLVTRGGTTAESTGRLVGNVSVFARGA